MAQAWICDACQEIVPEDEHRFLISISTSGGSIYHVHAKKACIAQIAGEIVKSKASVEKAEKALTRRMTDDELRRFALNDGSLPELGL